MMHSELWYEVCTHWGWFRLDDGAYRDYLAGRLWITWKPGGGQQPVEAACREPLPRDISDEALRLRDMAERYGIFDVLRRLMPGQQAPIPYKARMEGTSIEELNLSVRASNGLMRSGATTLGRLRQLIERQGGLRSVRNLGEKSEKEIMSSFFAACYRLMTAAEKAFYWQLVIDEAKSGRNENA